MFTTTSPDIRPSSVVAGARRIVFLLGITAKVKCGDVAAPRREPGSGTKRTCWSRLTMSAPEGKTGVPREPGHFRF
jgi:hypothetical protein